MPLSAGSKRSNLIVTVAAPLVYMHTPEGEPAKQLVCNAAPPLKQKILNLLNMIIIYMYNNCN
jgi:hypothetical protein